MSGPSNNNNASSSSYSSSSNKNNGIQHQYSSYGTTATSTSSDNNNNIDTEMSSFLVVDTSTTTKLRKNNEQQQQQQDKQDSMTVSSSNWHSFSLLLIGTCFGVVVTLIIGSYTNNNSNVVSSNTAHTTFPRLDVPPVSTVTVTSSTTSTTKTSTIDPITISSSSSSSSNGMNDTQQSGPNMKTRPVCTYYYSTTTTTTSTKTGGQDEQQQQQKSPTIIQTSMDKPSQPWSIVQCYPEVIPSKSSTSSTTTSTINAFGVPDAVVNVNFAIIPFSTNNNPILGFGGAFTEAAALNFNTLSVRGQEQALELLFGSNGLGYNMGRFPINSCDFSIESYNFDSIVDDFELQQFDTNVTHDVQLQINFAKRALHVYNNAWRSTSTSTTSNTSSSSYEEFKFFASPWSPTNWMKYPTWEDPPGSLYAHNMTYSANPVCIRDGVGPQSKYAAAWALYFSKFITAYEQHLQTRLWAVTVQNEPEFPAPWEACAYTPQNESEFIYYHLGPQLEKDHPHVRILGYDHNKEHIKEWVSGLVNTTQATEQNYKSSLPYIDGTAYHWYVGGMDRLLDGAFGTPNLHRIQAMLQQLNVTDHVFFNSEACHCPTTGYSGGDINNYWARAERYAHTILADLMAGSQGFVEWNLILDSIGGPNHLGNLCDSTILSVPHRASNSTVIDPLPSFEHTKPIGKSIIGDQRTLEELNAYGFNAKYIKDDGIVVQPLYYYMGQISRHVRPGSRAVSALINSNTGPGKIFQSIDSVVAGGGLNDLARDGIELTVWPCEGSTRQHFMFITNTNNNNNKSSTIRHHGMTLSTRIQVPGHDWLGNPTTSCLPRMNRPDLMGLTLTDCTVSNAGMYDIVKIENDVYGRYYMKLLNPSTTTIKKDGQSTTTTTSSTKEVQCLTILELANNGGAYGPRGGAQVAIDDCSNESAKWIIDFDSGTITSLHFAPTPPPPPPSSSLVDGTTTDNSDYAVCMTTGWPFLQIGAFIREKKEVDDNDNDNNNNDDYKGEEYDDDNNNNVNSNNSEKTIILLNEAREAANYIIKDESGMFFTTSNTNSNNKDSSSSNTMIISGSIPPRSIQTIIL